MNVAFIFCFYVLLIVGVGAMITGNATCDNELTVYADGKEVATHKAWVTAVELSIDDGTQVIGVHGQNKGGKAGITLILDNGIKTDTSWKCSSEYHSEWNKPWYNDSEWGDAEKQNQEPYGISELYGQADWIWTSNFKDNQDVYCRKKLPMPVNGATTTFYDSPTTSTQLVTSEPMISTYVSTVTTTVFVTQTQNSGTVKGTYATTVTAESNGSKTGSPYSDVNPSLNIQPTKSLSSQTNNCLASSPFVVINKDGKPQMMSRVCCDIIVVTDNVVAASEAKSSIFKELTVSKKNLTAVVSKKISAEDSRPSAQAVGYIGIVFFIIPIMLIILSDVPLVVQLCNQQNQGDGV